MAQVPATLWAYVALQALVLTWWGIDLFTLPSGGAAAIALLAFGGWAVLCWFLVARSRVAHVVAVVTALQWVVRVDALQGGATAIAAYLLLGPTALLLLCARTSRRHCWDRAERQYASGQPDADVEAWRACR